MDLFDTNNDNLELFGLIWLDASVNDDLSQDIQKELRLVINHLKTFEEKEECQKYIEQRSKDDRLMFIVSGRLGREVVPYIHKYRQIVSIYVYCFDKKVNEEWARNFTKVNLF